MGGVPGWHFGGLVAPKSAILRPPNKGNDPFAVPDLSKVRSEGAKHDSQVTFWIMSGP